MSGSGGQGKWMASSVKEKDITERREAEYLAKEITHRLPAKGQVIPTPKPNERVVFIPHFVCGLGFPLNPFVRGLMFYYGLDFHDLAPKLLPQHLGIYCHVRGLPPHSSPLRTMAQDLEREAEGGGWPTCGVRRWHGEQDAQCHMAQRYICGDRQGVAETVVLYHKASRRHLGRGFRIQVRSSNAAHLLEREGPKLVFVGRTDSAANVHPKHGG
ncbi:hypothetical protein ACQJBY_001447 [Aegilops geniculata]